MPLSLHNMCCLTIRKDQDEALLNPGEADAVIKSGRVDKAVNNAGRTAASLGTSNYCNNFASFTGTLSYLDEISKVTNYTRDKLNSSSISLRYC